MTNASSLRFASSRLCRSGLALWASVVMPLAGGSVALGDASGDVFGDEGLVAVSGVYGLASSLGAMSEEEIRAIDARSRNDEMAARSVVLESQSQVIPKPLWVRGGQPQAASPASREVTTAAPVFWPARPRTAAEIRAASEATGVVSPPQQAPSNPSVQAPARIDGPRPEATRPVTDDRPPMPFSRLLSQVQF